MQLKSLEWLRPIQYLYQNDPLFSPVIPETPESMMPKTPENMMPQRVVPLLNLSQGSEARMVFWNLDFFTWIVREFFFKIHINDDSGDLQNNIIDIVVD